MAVLCAFLFSGFVVHDTAFAQKYWRGENVATGMPVSLIIRFGDGLQEGASAFVEEGGTSQEGRVVRVDGGSDDARVTVEFSGGDERTYRIHKE